MTGKSPGFSPFLLVVVSASRLSDVDDRLGEGLRIFLRQIVPDAALDMPVRIAACELLGIGAGIRMRCAVGIALERDGGHADGRTRGEPFLQLIIFRLAFGE